MAENVYTRMLARAAELEGSTPALASVLRVPLRTLDRWMSGKAPMPHKAFLTLTHRLAEREKFAAEMTVATSPGGQPPVPPGQASPERLTFPIGQLLARCSRCDGTAFRRADSTTALRMLSVLVCCSCGNQVIHGDLLVELGNDVVAHCRAGATSKARRAARPSAMRRASAVKKKEREP